MSLTTSPSPARFVLVLFAVALSACASTSPTGSQLAGSQLDARLLGVWTDEGGATHTIAPGADGYAVGVVDSDGEVFDVTSVEYDGGVLTWVYDVPSTGYTVTHRTTSIGPDRIEVRWENQEGATGTDTLTRVE